MVLIQCQTILDIKLFLVTMVFFPSFAGGLQRAKPLPSPKDSTRPLSQRHDSMETGPLLSLITDGSKSKPHGTIQC